MKQMKKAPFIENIIIIGLPKSELKTIQDKNIISQRDFHNISGTILENYQSKYLSQSLDKTFLSSLLILISKTLLPPTTFHFFLHHTLLITFANLNYT